VFQSISPCNYFEFAADGFLDRNDGMHLECEPCGRSNQLITYFIFILLIVLVLGTIAVWTG
jgi:hypothetical protein